MSKKRIYVKLEGTEQLIPIAWYEGTPLISILGLIKEVIRLIHDIVIGFRNNEQRQQLKC